MNIEKEAIKFAKNFKKEPSFTDLKNYLENNLHYKLLFFDTTIAQKELDFLKLKVSRKEKGLTVNVSEGTSKFVFMRPDLSDDDKIHCILHEIGHIVLGHMEISSRELSSERTESDAELFAYMVLANVKRRAKASYKIPCIVLTIIVCLLSAVLGLELFGNTSNPADVETGFAIETSTHDPVYSIKSVDSEYESDTADVSEHSEYMVYVTATGKKYHQANCRYVKGKSNIKELTLEEADERYSPCLVCDP